MSFGHFIASVFFIAAAIHGRHLQFPFASQFRGIHDGDLTGISPESVMEIAAEVDMQFVIPIKTATRLSSTPIRLHGLDALRGIATVLVVLLHAGIPYMTKPMPFLLWPVRDLHPSTAVDGLTWCIECFIMPLFFVLAGFFSMGLLVSHGETKFLRGRTKRLLSTQFAAILTILPLCLVVWLLGWMADGLYAPTDFSNIRLAPELEAEIYGVAHLWFLQNLYLYCLILCGVSWLAKRVRRSIPIRPNLETDSVGHLDAFLYSVWKPVIAAIPCAFILYFDPRIVLGFYQSITPVISKLVYYAIYFFVGVLLYRHLDRLQLHARFGKRYLCIACILFSAVLPLIHEHTTVALCGLRLGILVSLVALFAWFTTFGLIAIFLRAERGDNSVTRYLADASFWVYLIHLPFVALVHIAIARLPVPSECKFLLAGTTALALALMTYHVFVRDRWIGEFLKGRSRRCTPTVDAPELVFGKFPVIAPHYANLDLAVQNVKKTA